MKKIISIFFFVLVGCSLENQDLEVKIDEVYLISTDWGTSNPFLKKIDTIRVIDIKNDYVLWEYKDSTKKTDRIEIFKHYCRPISYKEN